MKRLANAKARMTRVEMTPFPVYKKWYFIMMATIGVVLLIKEIGIRLYAPIWGIN